MFKEFLPENYEAPVAAGSYLKLKEGEYKLRILSKPILGWEDWSENNVYRFRLENKPKAPLNPKRAIKHFWTMIVWNYNDEQIYAWHITQASIRKELEKLVSDPDWGSPFGYDIRIKRVGSKIEDTEYFVTPLPHKPIPKEAIEAFNAKPCWLDAMYDNKDPFAQWPDKTEGCFSEDKPKATNDVAIAPNQFKELVELIGDDKEYLKTLEANLLKHFQIKSLKDLPKEKYEAVYKSVKLHAEERLKKELGNNDLPF